jgi:hypothetical protein
VFAELKDPVRRKVELYGLAREIEPEHFFPTVEAAVDAFQRQTGATWPAPRTASDVGTGVLERPDPPTQAQA